MFYIDNADEIIPIHRQYSYILFADSRHTTPHTRVEYFGSILFIYFVCANEFDIGLAFANFNCEGADVLVHRVVFWFRGVRRKIFVFFFSLIFSVIFFFACEIFVLFYLIDSRMFRAVINRVACQSVKPIRWTGQRSSSSLGAVSEMARNVFKHREYSAEGGYVWNSPYEPISMPDMTIDQYVWKNMAKWSNKVAIVCSVTGRKYTYAKLRDHCAAFAIRLRTQFGLKQNDVVAIYLPNVPGRRD